MKKNIGQPFAVSANTAKNKFFKSRNTVALQTSNSIKKSIELSSSKGFASKTSDKPSRQSMGPSSSQTACNELLAKTLRDIPKKDQRNKAIDLKTSQQTYKTYLNNHISESSSNM